MPELISIYMQILKLNKSAVGAYILTKKKLAFKNKLKIIQRQLLRLSNCKTRDIKRKLIKYSVTLGGKLN